MVENEEDDDTMPVLVVGVLDVVESCCERPSSRGRFRLETILESPEGSDRIDDDGE